MLTKKIKNPDVIILGAGIAGCLSAIKIAESGMKVLLLEKQEDILLGASNITPGRMGLGFHYEHAETAIAYLHATIEFVKAFPDFAIGREDPGGYLQRGRYFIVKDSLFSKEAILDTYQKIKEEYKRLVQEDESNRVFGDPDNIFRILEPEEYASDVNTDIVAAGIETAECLLDWPAFKSALIEKLNSCKNISILRNCKADTFDYDFENDKYSVKCSKQDDLITPYFEVKAEFIINATWQYVEEITNKAGLVSGLPKDGRTNRLKVLAEVSLPESLQNKNSMFFCMGPHCMFSNMGNGFGLMSYAPNTNVATSTGIYVPPSMEIFLKENRTEVENEEMHDRLKTEHFGEKIIAGVAKYIPDMQDATLIGLRFGIVKTQGAVDIFDHKSPFHIRNYSGVEEITLGWINNSAMKLLYGLNNANMVLALIKEHKEIKDNLFEIVQESFARRDYEVDTIKLKAIVSILKRYFLRSELNADVRDKALDKIIEMVKAKSDVTISITNPASDAKFEKKAVASILGRYRNKLYFNYEDESCHTPESDDEINSTTDEAAFNQAAENIHNIVKIAI